MFNRVIAKDLPGIIRQAAQKRQTKTNQDIFNRGLTFGQPALTSTQRLNKANENEQPAKLVKLKKLGWFNASEANSKSI